MEHIRVLLKDEAACTRGTTMQAVITSGEGLWSPPLRVGTNAEVAVIDPRFE